jgi:hypothetical protein
VIGTGRTALDHDGQAPRETDAYRPTDPAPGDVLAEPGLSQWARLAGKEALLGAHHTLAAADLALRILVAAGKMAGFLEWWCSPP